MLKSVDYSTTEDFSDSRYSPWSWAPRKPFVAQRFPARPRFASNRVFQEEKEVLEKGRAQVASA